MRQPGSGELKPADTQINVAQLLKQPVGTTRRYALRAPGLPLGEGRATTPIEGEIKLTLLGHGLLVTGQAETSVELTCVRCLEEYAQPVTLELEEEFRPSIDVTSGMSIPHAEAKEEADSDFFLIGEDHVLDLTEALRQAVWLNVPMVPRCGDACPGPGAPAAGEDEADVDVVAGGIDTRLAALQHLLEQHGAPAVEPVSDRRRAPAD